MRDIGKMLTLNVLNIAAFYSGLHILILVALSVFVIRERLTRRIGLGHAEDRQFFQIVRMHGHAAEFLPPVIAVLLFMALQDSGALALHLFGIATLVGRVLHAAGLHSSPNRSLGRLFGTIITLTSLTFGSLFMILLPLLRG